LFCFLEAEIVMVTVTVFMMTVMVVVMVMFKLGFAVDLGHTFRIFGVISANTVEIRQ
jgi:hypothetical protein